MLPRPRREHEQAHADSEGKNVRTLSILLASHHINVERPSNLIKLDLLHNIVL